jgi:hypothetical protein
MGEPGKYRSPSRVAVDRAGETGSPASQSAAALAHDVLVTQPGEFGIPEPELPDELAAAVRYPADDP